MNEGVTSHLIHDPAEGGQTGSGWTGPHYKPSKGAVGREHRSFGVGAGGKTHSDERLFGQNGRCLGVDFGHQICWSKELMRVLHAVDELPVHLRVG